MESSALNSLKMKVLEDEDFSGILNAELMDGSITGGSQHGRLLGGCQRNDCSASLYHKWDVGLDW